MTPPDPMAPIFQAQEARLCALRVAGVPDVEAARIARASLTDEPPPMTLGPVTSVSWDPEYGFTYHGPCPNACEGGLVVDVCSRCSGLGDSPVYPHMVCSDCRGRGGESYECETCRGLGAVEVQSTGEPL